MNHRRRRMLEKRRRKRRPYSAEWMSLMRLWTWYDTAAADLTHKKILEQI